MLKAGGVSCSKPAGNNRYQCLWRFVILKRGPQTHAQVFGLAAQATRTDSHGAVFSGYWPYQYYWAVALGKTAPRNSGNSSNSIMKNLSGYTGIRQGVQGQAPDSHRSPAGLAADRALPPYFQSISTSSTRLGQENPGCGWG